MHKASKYVLSGIIAFSVAGVAFAGQIPAMKLVPANSVPKIMTLQTPHSARMMKLRHRIRHNFSNSWRRALRKTKQLTSMQAKQVAMTAVTLYGDSMMRVGQVTPVMNLHGRQNYRVQLTNKQGKVIAMLLMNGSSGRVMKSNLK